MNLRLPLFISRKHKWAQGLAGGSLALSLYLASNHFPIFRPIDLPYTGVDQFIAFMPGTVWVYFSAFILMAIPYFRRQSLADSQKYFYSVIILAGVSNLIFWVCPTAYPRSDFPIPGAMSGPTLFLVEWMRILDTKFNCAPSLHVSMSFLAAFCLWYSVKPANRTVLPFAWAAVVALSTLTTKQHYFVDVVSGLLLGAAVYFAVHRRIQITTKDKSRL